MEEFEGQCRDQHRIRRLKKALTGVGMEKGPKLSEDALADLARRTLTDLEEEFEAFFNERQARFEEVAQQHELDMQERRREVLKLQGQRGSLVAQILTRTTKSASVQTEPRR